MQILQPNKGKWDAVPAIFPLKFDRLTVLELVRALGSLSTTRKR